MTLFSTLNIQVLVSTALFIIPAVSYANESIKQVPSSEHPVLRQIQAEISAERLKTDVTKLVSFGTRHTLSETKSNTQGIGAARRWIKAEFEKISAECGDCLDVLYQKQTFSGEKRIPNPTEVVKRYRYSKRTT